MIKEITDKLISVGVDDYDLDLFEAHYPVPHGMAYNSYVIMDEKIAICDAVDERKTTEWLANITEALGSKEPTYLIIHHMEPDHSASIEAFCTKYPNTYVVGNAKIFSMISQFFPNLNVVNKIEVKEGDTLELGEHIFEFYMAPMVHWPEVMISYEKKSKTFFSADAFGKFGTNETEDVWVNEARRYYFGIISKYGMQVKAALKKMANKDIDRICSLHGPVLEGNIKDYIDIYTKWANYEPESKGVCIFYSSVYGNTKKAVKTLEEELFKRGIESLKVFDLSRCDVSVAIENAFRYDTAVLATTTYNAEIFPCMRVFIEELKERNFQKRRIGFIENGSWAPLATKVMKSSLEGLKELEYLDTHVTIKSALNDDTVNDIKKMADEIVSIY